MPEARISIMSSVVDVLDASKSDMVLPAMETLIKDPAPIMSLFGPSFSRYSALVASTFLSVSTGDLNAGAENSVWQTFALALRTYFRSSKSFLCCGGSCLIAVRCKHYYQEAVFRCTGREAFCAFGYGTPGSSLRNPFVGRIVRQ